MLFPSLAYMAGLAVLTAAPGSLLPAACFALLAAAVFLLVRKKTAVLVFLCIGTAAGVFHRAVRTDFQIPEKGFFNGAVTVSGFPKRRADGQYEVSARNGRLIIVSPDAHAFYRTQKLDAAGFIKRGPDPRRAYLYLKDHRTLAPGFAPFGLVSRIRRAVTGRLSAVTHPESRALVSAMILGERSGLEYRAVQVFRMTGLSHLLAVSGLHVGILAAGFLFLFRLFLDQKKAFVLAAAAVLLYAGAAGFSASILRAAVMFAVYSGLKAVGRPADALDAILFSAVIVLSYDPMFLTDTGFALSYGSVLGIYFFYRLFRKIVFPAVPQISEGVSVTLSASVPTLPLQVLTFGGFSPYFVIANAAVVPVFTVLAYLVFIYTAVVLAGAARFAGILESAIGFLWTACVIPADALSRLPFGFLTLNARHSLPIAVLFAVAAAALAVYRPLRYRMALGRIRKLAACRAGQAVTPAD